MKLLPALLALFLLSCADTKSSAKTVGEVTIINDAPREAAARAVSFGQVFAPGAVKQGDPVELLVGGRALPTQMDAKALNADGSVRHAVMTIEAPALPGGEKLNGELVIGAPRPTTGTLSYAAAPDLEVRLELSDGGGRRRLVELRLPTIVGQAASAAPDYWLNGPLAREQRYRVDVDRRLQLEFDVFTPRAGPTRVDVIFHNDWSDLKSTDAVTYNVELALGDKVVFQARKVRHYPRATWHRLVWSDGAEPLRTVPRLGDLIAAAATPRYDAKYAVSSAVREAELKARSRNLARPLNPGTVTQYMPMTGGRPDLGPLPAWAVTDLLVGEESSRRLLIANADAAGSIPWHVRERANGSALTLDRYPNLWLDSRAQDNAPLPEPFVEEAEGWSLDDAHQPSLTYLPYVLTGLRYYKDELTQQAAYVLLSYDPNYRSGSAGLITVAQVRGLAWSLRTIANAAYILPADDPLRPYFEAKLKGNLERLVRLYVEDRTMKSARELEGWVPGPYKPGAVAPWQQGFLAVVLGWINDMGYAEAGRTLRWMSPFLTGLFTSGDKGFAPRMGTTYTLQVAAGDEGPNYGTWAEAAKATAREAGGAEDLPNYGMILRSALAAAYSVNRSGETRRAYDLLSRRLGGETEGGDPTFAITPP